MPGSEPKSVLLLGAGGGVATALLQLLSAHPVCSPLVASIHSIFLLDASRPVKIPDHLPDAHLLPCRKIESGEDLFQVIRAHGINQVIELAEVDTINSILAAEKGQADYLCTGFEAYTGRPEFDLLGPSWYPWSMAMLPRFRPKLRCSHLVGSGMNPGIVNALVSASLERFGARLGVPGDPEELDLYAILFTEEDSTVELARPPARHDEGVFPMTWNPLHCLYEVLAPVSKFMERGEVRRTSHSPADALYKARCGRALIEGMLISHEEVFSTGTRYPSLEVGYIYCLPAQARDALRRFPDRRKPEDWPNMRRLYPPETTQLCGWDRIGVLLCSRTYGEFWMGFENSCNQASRFSTNATLLQVAAGVIAGWMQLGAVRGIHLVEEVNCTDYLAVVESILGPPTVFYDPGAVPCRLESRIFGSR